VPRLSQRPEVVDEANVGEEALQFCCAPGSEVAGEAVAVPLLGECPDVVQRDASTSGGSVFLRPKEGDGASSFDDVVPPLARRNLELDQPVVIVEPPVDDVSFQ
jgi:hypothetical protein